MKKIGIMGGTFDPPHIGHFIIAETVKHDLKLDEIWFMPTFEPPHKAIANSTSEDRKEMLKLVIDEESDYRLEEIEYKRGGKSYTIDTMIALRKMYPDTVFYFIIGADMVAYLPHWHKIDQLIELVRFVGVARPNYQLETKYPIEIIAIPLMDISSSMIRERIKNQRQFKYFLPEKVFAYIKEHKLYGFKSSQNGD